MTVRLIVIRISVLMCRRHRHSLPSIMNGHPSCSRHDRVRCHTVRCSSNASDQLVVHLLCEATLRCTYRTWHADYACGAAH